MKPTTALAILLILPVTGLFFLKENNFFQFGIDNWSERHLSQHFFQFPGKDAG